MQTRKTSKEERALSILSPINHPKLLPGNYYPWIITTVTLLNLSWRQTKLKPRSINDCNRIQKERILNPCRDFFFVIDEPQ